MKNSIIFSSPFHNFLLELDSACTTARSPNRHVMLGLLKPSFLKSLEPVMLSWDTGLRKNQETGSQPPWIPDEIFQSQMSLPD